MSRFFVSLALLASTLHSASQQAVGRDAELRVMSFNVWSAEDSTVGRQRITAAIQQSGADLIGLQEMGPVALRSIAESLGYHYYDQRMGSEAILSRYRILDTAPQRFGVQVELAPGHPAWIFNTHLFHAPYGPYQLNGIAYNGGRLYDPALPESISRVIADQVTARGRELTTLLAATNDSGALDSGHPIFVTGDFNEPSHLDWTALARDAGVHVAEVAWPTSVAIEQAGLQDSWRAVYEDEIAAPGRTWSPIYPATYLNSGDNRTTQPTPLPEPQDRIDMVYFGGTQVAPLSSWRSGPPERGELEELEINGYPSDHNAVTSAFRISGLDETRLDFRALGLDGAAVPSDYGSRVLSSPNLTVEYAAVAPPHVNAGWFIANDAADPSGAARLAIGLGEFADGSVTFSLRLRATDGEAADLRSFSLRDIADGSELGHEVAWELWDVERLLQQGVASVPNEGVWRPPFDLPVWNRHDLELRLRPITGAIDELLIDDVVFRQIPVPEPTGRGMGLATMIGMGLLCLTRRPLCTNRHSIKFRALPWLVVTVTLCGAAGRADAAFSNLFVFGDSFSDMGNVYAATRGFIPADPPYFQGRFSNGPVWVEHLAGSLGLPLTANGANPAVIKGNNFAAGGARASVDVPVPLLGTIPSVQHQVNYFAAAINTAPSDALYVVYGGYNDINFATDPDEPLSLDAQRAIVDAAAWSMRDTLQSLVNVGARDFLVPNLADFGLSPEARFVRQNAPLAGELTRRFNDSLANVLTEFQAEHNVQVYQLDVFALTQELVADATLNGGQRYGITNIDVPLFSEAGATLDPSTVLFADNIHVSAVTQRYLGAAAAAIVPEPAAVALMLIGCAIAARPLRRSVADRSRRRDERRHD